MKRVNNRFLFTAGLVVALSVAVPTTPADAECVYAEVYVTREQAAPVYVNNGCVVPTPWYQEVFLPGHLTLTNLPPGTPNGYFVDIRIPIP
jgi:hypothetical protein